MSMEGGRTMPWEDGLGEEAASLDRAYQAGHAKENLTTQVASLFLREFERFVAVQVQLGTCTCPLQACAGCRRQMPTPSVMHLLTIALQNSTQPGLVLAHPTLAVCFPH